VPLVSVVVPLYNSQRYIATCIESVLNQSHADWELVIVDDGSTDSSADIAQDYARQDDRIQVLFHEAHANKGVSVTRRKAIAHSRGDYIALLDADDAFEPSKLEVQLQNAATHPDCIVYHCGAHCIDTNGAIIEGLNWTSEFNTFADHARVYSFRNNADFLQRNNVLNSSAMVRATSLKQLPFGFEQLFQYEDWTLWALLSGQGPFFVQPERLVQYRVHDDSATAKVVNSPLVAIYSHIEFLLSVVALAKDETISRRAAEILEAKLAQAVGQYGQVTGTVGRSSEFMADLDAARISEPATSRRRKWYRRLWKRAA